MATIRALGVEDAEAYSAIRRRSLELAPQSFASSPDEDPGVTLEGARARLDPARVAAGSATFGAFTTAGALADPVLVGVTTFHREVQQKLCHRARIFGVFVEPEHRRQGLANELLLYAIGYAREQPGVELLQLAVTSTEPAAIALYERRGFVRYGLELRALKVGETYYDEILMQLELGS